MYGEFEYRPSEFEYSWRRSTRSSAGLLRYSSFVYSADACPRKSCVFSSRENLEKSSAHVIFVRSYELCVDASSFL